MFKRSNWIIFVILVLASTFGLIAIVPYSLALQGGLPSPEKLPMPVGQLILIQLGTQVALFVFAAGVGLSFARSIGLGLPVLEGILRREPVWPKVRAFLPLSVIIGLVGSLLIIALDVFVFQPLLKAQLGAGNALGVGSPHTPAPWQGFLAAFYGGINEEILLRLLVMSFLAWIGRAVSKTAEGGPTLTVLWVANILAAVLFGLGHLPVTSALMALTPLVVIRAIVLNGLVGVGFGYLYFKHGLESAMLSHFCADLVLHVLFAI
jgi:membrane protease YdiL (CAAX protease family)